MQQKYSVLQYRQELGEEHTRKSLEIVINTQKQYFVTNCSTRMGTS